MRSWVVLSCLAACASSRATPPREEAHTAPPAAPAPVAEDPSIPTPNRHLTAGEKALLQPIFRDSIDYDRVRVINNSFPLQPEGVYMTPRGSIFAPGELYREDFSADVFDRAVFVHEMTHVWQFLNGMDLIGAGAAELIRTRGDYDKAYPYTLDGKRDLVDYGMEQQAAIIEDYFVMTVLHDEPYRIENAGLSPGDRAALYAAVLKKFRANPRYARQAQPIASAKPNK